MTRLRENLDLLVNRDWLVRDLPHARTAPIKILDTMLVPFESGRYRAPHSALRDPDDFAERFEELCAGRSWINLHAAGMWNGCLIVTLEYKPPTGSPATSVVLSGPSTRVKERGGDVSAEIEIIDER